MIFASVSLRRLRPARAAGRWRRGSGAPSRRWRSGRGVVGRPVRLRRPGRAGAASGRRSRAARVHRGADQPDAAPDAAWPEGGTGGARRAAAGTRGGLSCSLATAPSRARFASGFLPKCDATCRDATREPPARACGRGSAHCPGPARPAWPAGHGTEERVELLRTRHDVGAALGGAGMDDELAGGVIGRTRQGDLPCLSRRRTWPRLWRDREGSTPRSHRHGAAAEIAAPQPDRFFAHAATRDLSPMPSSPESWTMTNLKACPLVNPPEAA